MDSAYVHLSGEAPVTNEIRPYSDNTLPAQNGGDIANATSLASNTSYTVSTAAGLQKLAELVNADGNTHNGYTITMTQDIDCAGATMTPIGGKLPTDETYDSSAEPPAPAFSGTFDGGNHTISNLTIEDTDQYYLGTGLFGYVSYGTVKNLNVSGTFNGNNQVSVIVGACDHGTVTGCKASGSVDGSWSVGGVVGKAIGGTIEECGSDVTVDGTHWIGGIVGYAEGTTGSVDLTISGCNFSGSINKLDEAEPASGYSSNIYYVGGIVGSANYCAMTGCTSTGTVAGMSNIGGIAGSASDSTITGCRFGDEITSRSGASAAVTGEYSIGGIVGGAMDSVVSGCKSAARSPATCKSAASWGSTLASAPRRSPFC